MENKVGLCLLNIFTGVAQAVLWLFIALGAVAPGAWGQADVQGQWSTLSYTMPINPIHVALLHNGKILVVTGSGKCVPVRPVVLRPAFWSLEWLGSGRSGYLERHDHRIDGTVGHVLHFHDPAFGWTDADQWWHIDLPVFRISTIRDLRSGQQYLHRSPNMAHGRWYPTLVLLSDGRVMTFSGLDDVTGATNTTVEIFTVGSGWSSPIAAGWTPPLYPRLHLLPSGNVFYSGPSQTSYLFNVTNETWTQMATSSYGRTYGSSVLLPLTPANNYDPKVLVLGGDNPATSTTELIDLGASSPTWS